MRNTFKSSEVRLCSSSREYLNLDFITCSTELINGFSSITSTSGWLLRMVSSNVVPDLGNPTKKTGKNSFFLVSVLFTTKFLKYDYQNLQSNLRILK